ncbi:hypothetical protein ABIC63_002131 [Pseudacidovorax sp. 1753]|uniref:hypothetical protein n=1 Tax=Pseudacidovorax sp. 1753 TaxID=3156419 RepID=UPI003391988D
MPKIALAEFNGAALAVHPKLIPDTVGTASRNQRPGRGDLRPWRQPLPVATVPAGRHTIYRMGRDVASDTQYWLSWPGIVHAVRGFVSGDTVERTFYTGDGAPKQTNTSIGLAAPPYPSAYRELGVPAPASALLVTPNNTGEATDTELRYYTYTYVTDLGEESAPAPVSAQVQCKTDDTLAIAGVSPPPAGAYGIDRIRFYRTQSATSGDAEFFFLREEPSTIGSTTDDNRALGEVLPTDGWLVPPSTLTGLTAMWNGMAAAINSADGSVRYCVAYKLYAWPVAFETLPPNAKAVALAVYGQRLLVLTTGKPVLVQGSGPDALDEQPLEIAQACVAARSAVGLGHGVAWASPDGLAYFGDGGASLCTIGLLTRDQWTAMNPESITAVNYEGFYFASYLDMEGVRRGFFLDPSNPKGIFFLDQGYEAMFVDEHRDALFVLDGTAVKKWDAGEASMTALFRSKVFAGPERNYSAARVEADAYPVTMHVDVLDLHPDVVAARIEARPGLFTSPATGVLRHTHVVDDRRPFRLPGGVLSRTHQVTIETSNPVQWATLASSMRELSEEG